MNHDFANIWDVLTQHFSLGQSSLHGPVHWKNVQRNGLELARSNGADVVVVRLFAVFHDCERQNEGHDPEHGRRAAGLARHLHGDLFLIDEARLELLCHACELHNDGQTSGDVTVGTCWDADRLELPRVGITPHPAKMSTDEGRRLAASYRRR